MIDAVFSGTPLPSFPAAAGTVALGVDKSTGALWDTATGSWAPAGAAPAKANVLAATAAVANVLTFSAPVNGLYRITGFVDQATATNGTPGALQYSYTNADSGSVVAAASFTTPAATTGIGQGQTGSVTVLAKAGTNIVVSALAPTTLTQNIYARVEFLG